MKKWRKEIKETQTSQVKKNKHKSTKGEKVNSVRNINKRVWDMEFREKLDLSEWKSDGGGGSSFF